MESNSPQLQHNPETYIHCWMHCWDGRCK